MTADKTSFEKNGYQFIDQINDTNMPEPNWLHVRRAPDASVIFEKATRLNENLEIAPVHSGIVKYGKDFFRLTRFQSEGTHPVDDVNNAGNQETFVWATKMTSDETLTFIFSKGEKNRVNAAQTNVNMEAGKKFQAASTLGFTAEEIKLHI